MDHNIKAGNYKSGRITVENRTFLIEFWDDLCPYVRISEIVMKNKRQHWYSKKTIPCEAKQVIDCGWTEQNRLEWAQNRIKQFLQDEKDKQEELDQIEAFCAGQKKERR